MNDEIATVCAECGGSGWKLSRQGQWETMVRCGCRRGKEPIGLVRAARIPNRYMHCTLENFITDNKKVKDPTLAKAQLRTREFVNVYPALKRGLLFMGNTGAGKTHLAVAALKELIRTKHVRGVYYDFLDLVQQLQMSFDANGRREDILGPVVEADVLVLDELGAGKLTPWVMDLMYYVVNTRYMAERVTIFTTNFWDQPQKPGEETLADRISARIRSRLHEMCDTVELRGEDFRAHPSHFRGVEERSS